MRSAIACAVTLILLATPISKLAAKPPTQQTSQAVDQAWQLYQSGNCKQAQSILHDALRVAPEMTLLYFNLGVSAERCGEPRLAAQYYRQYSSGNPAKRSWVDARATLIEQQLTPAEGQKDQAAPPQGFPWWGWVLIGGGAALVLGISIALAAGGGSSDGFSDSY